MMWLWFIAVCLGTSKIQIITFSCPQCCFYSPPVLVLPFHVSLCRDFPLSTTAPLQKEERNQPLIVELQWHLINLTTLLLCCRLSAVSSLTIISNISSIVIAHPPAALTSQLLWEYRGSTDAQTRRMFPMGNRNLIFFSVGSEWKRFKLFCRTEVCYFPSETHHWNIVEALCIKEQTQRYYLIAIAIL